MIHCSHTKTGALPSSQKILLSGETGLGKIRKLPLASVFQLWDYQVTMNHTDANDAAMDHDMKEELARLRAENQALKKKDSSSISLKVSEKGGVSLYGLGRFPVTLYKEQWDKLLDHVEDIRSFLRENHSRLKLKD